MKRRFTMILVALLTIAIIAPKTYASEYEPTPTEIARQYGYPNVTDAYQPEVVLMLVKPGKFYMTINLTKNGTLLQ